MFQALRAVMETYITRKDLYITVISSIYTRFIEVPTPTIERINYTQPYKT